MKVIGKLRLYLETTVFNYYFDEDREGHQDVVKLFEAIRAGRFEGYTSQYVIQELRAAPEPKRGKMLNLVDEYGIILLSATPKVTELALLYIERGIVPASYLIDSSHIAIASVYKLDYLISYNFRHISHDRTRRFANDTNEEEGLDYLNICTAKEVLDNG